jgi:hypothetical protein
MRYQEFCRLLLPVATVAVTASIMRTAPVLAGGQDPVLLPARPIVIDAASRLIPVPPELTPELRAEVDAWKRDYLAWRQWAAEWRNRGEPGLFSRRSRRPKPNPPDWLIQVCSEPLDDPSLAETCALVTDWQSDFLTAQYRTTQTTARTQQEVPTKTVWWEHIHVDALWPVAQAHGTAFGVFGTHLTIDVAGRLEVFGAPGFIMLTLPTSAGRDWAPATDWGVSFRLGRFPLPGMTAKAMLHLNVARAWLFGAGNSPFSRYVDLVGFSLTFPQTASSP